MFTFRETTQGILEYKLDLSSLYSDERSRSHFERKWLEFIESDETHPEVFRREGSDTIVFFSESLIPVRLDDRPPVLLLLGIPASHSVAYGMCFSFEGDNREHRFWLALRKAGILKFSSDGLSSPLPWHERNRIRKEEFFTLQYSSPFRIGISVYFSIPSAASDPKWSGVAGLLRLFGQKALRVISMEEDRRIADMIQRFMVSGGGIVTFQKNAYEEIRSPETPPYSIDLAKNGGLLGKYKHDSRVYLVGAPPTRFLHSKKYHRLLTCHKDYLIEKLAF